MFPGDAPQPAQQYWQAVDRWYGTGTRQVPKREELVKKYTPEISVRSLDRHRLDVRYRDWIGPWPPRPGDLRPWLRPDWRNGQPVAPRQAPATTMVRRVRQLAFDEQGNVVEVLQEFDAETGAWVSTRLLISGIRLQDG